MELIAPHTQKELLNKQQENTPTENLNNGGNGLNVGVPLATVH